MSYVELIYDTNCPNVALARQALIMGFSRAGLQPSWTEWDRALPESPNYVRGYGSPTILMGGRNIAGVAPGAEGSNFRLHRNSSGLLQGAPLVEQVAMALRARGGQLHKSERTSGWRGSFATAPGIALAFLPKRACPAACLPAYAGLMSSIGLGFLLDTVYLFPLTVAFLVLAAGALAFRARTRRRYGPLVTGMAAAFVVLVGKFVFESDVALYGGIGLLVAASLWNTWPQAANGAGSCAKCVPQEPAIDTENAR